METITSVNIKISQLQPNNGQIQGLPANPRFIKDEKYNRLKKSIEDNPEMLSYRELLVYPHGDKYVIIGGNMRYRALKELGYKEAPCKIIAEGTEVKHLCAYAIKDNNGFGEYDFDALANEWDEFPLTDWGVDLPEVVSPDDFDEGFSLPSGGKTPFQQMTFTLADMQADLIKAALSKINKDIIKEQCFGNTNQNGNALYIIVKEWAAQKK